MNKESQKRLRIIALDDDPDILEIYRQALSFADDPNYFGTGFDLTLCRRGNETLEAVRNSAKKDDSFAVVFLDLNLGDGPDGLHFGQEIRKIDPYVNFVAAKARSYF